jgi:hypothetical protein
MLPEIRRAHNELRIQKVYRPMRGKILAVIRDLEGHAWQPLIDAKVHRTPAQQAELKRRGVSTVSYSFHNVTARDGTPESLACDITHAPNAWDSSQHFWLMLAAAAQAHGLETGIRWGLKQNDRAAINRAIVQRQWTEPRLRLGWDPAHVQPRNFSLLRARLGLRPTF